MFEKTLALYDNPFDPKFPNGPPNLAGNPLRIDQNDALLQLFCWKLAGLDTKRTQIATLLFGPQGSGGTPGGARQGIIVVRGGKGTGKTTLASYIKHCVLSAPTQSTGGWKSHDANFPALDDPVSGSQVFPTKLAEVRNTLTTMVGPSPTESPANVLLFLDDVPADCINSVINLFQEFNRYNQIYVVTTTDPKLAQAELDCSCAARIVIIETGNVNAVDLQSYMTDRVEYYRKPLRAEFNNVSPFFPWPQTAPQRLLGAQTSGQPLRLLNRKLSRQIEDHHQKLLLQQPNVDVGTVAQVDLPRYLITE